MAESDIKLGIYRHFKGNEYEVLFIALDSETLEEKIVYRDINKGTVWLDQNVCGMKRSNVTVKHSKDLHL